MNSIFIKLTGNKNKHETLDCFEFWPGLTCMYEENHAYNEISAYKYSDSDTSYKENHAYEEISTDKEIYT